MKKINIFLKDITESGGGERVCANLANAFCLDYEVEIFSFYKSQPEPIYKLNQKVKITYLSTFDLKNAKGIKKNFLKNFYRYFLSFKIIFNFRQKSNEILLANDGYFVPFFKNKALKYLRIWHIKAPKKKKMIFNRFDTIIILSSRELEKWKKWHKNIQVIPNFLPFISPKENDLSQKVVLSVGRFTQEKGFFRLIDIWEMVQKNEKFKEWKLHIIGDGILKEKIQDKIKIKNLEKSIILKPFTREIEKEYLKASIYVMTSHFEGFGMVLAESASYTIPSIAFDINTGPSDIIDNKKSGFLIEDGNLQEFANKLKILMQDESLREKFGKNAKEKVQKEFSKEVIMKKWNKIASF
ncbi:glycosyltransferase family 4 protein [Campylobacter coli]|uniref:Glycosyltransferase family 4 protein n=1 Tax=Campylobacter coli TaxID=195 RepID=A0A6C7K3I0_CAMCO|nr:glycosyltransferase family 4 protein [Campylobacter coli]EAH8728010.1 glycosyltransferase family 4 protein [Campylobacter coli]EAH9574796.1 glycosyltransferase family 4 protein [Campylobacter coli]EAI5942848.1 glycosyltransferase family 4 protein [Campylobacter coli]EAI8676337.1 glycosyltransferase family 4 protein [Campylobacter coli]EAK1432376.1 glycosyltransferase family 4 protein [Campylobacter coli]